MDKESIRQLPSLRQDNKTCTCRVNSSEVDGYFCRFPVKWSTIYGLMKHPRLSWCVLSNMFNLSSWRTRWRNGREEGDRDGWKVIRRRLSLSSHSGFFGNRFSCSFKYPKLLTNKLFLPTLTYIEGKKAIQDDQISYWCLVLGEIMVLHLY